MADLGGACLDGGRRVASLAVGWGRAGLLLVSTPLDMVASRLATLRLRPLPSRMLSRRALWPAAGLALLALGWWESRHGSGWGALVTAGHDASPLPRPRGSRRRAFARSEIWLFSRRNAIFAAIPFALVGAWTAYLVAMLIYAAASFFLVQHSAHLGHELTRS